MEFDFVFGADRAFVIKLLVAGVVLVSKTCLAFVAVVALSCVGLLPVLNFGKENVYRFYARLAFVALSPVCCQLFVAGVALVKKMCTVFVLCTCRLACSRHIKLRCDSLWGD